MADNTGLFFGSFNPIHIGHMAIANYIVENTGMSEIWFVVSPQNPFKKRRTLLTDQLRLELVEIAINNDDRFKACDIEFRMPKPSFTIDTLMYLKEKYPGKNFGIILGSDNLEYFHKWKNYHLIEEYFKRYIYPRPGTNEEDFKSLKNSEVVNAPQMDISSSFIRESIREGKKVDKFLPPGVWEFIEKMGLYR